MIFKFLICSHITNVVLKAKFLITYNLLAQKVRKIVICILFAMFCICTLYIYYGVIKDFPAPVGCSLIYCYS